MSLVLIVDDQRGIRELLVNWIGREGYQTAQAANAEAALDEMMGRPADVVFCDVQISGQGGFWLAARLHERFPDTAIILATGDSNEPPVISLQPGVVVYLAMPFGREAVLKAVTLVCSGIGCPWPSVRRRTTGPIQSRHGSRLPRGRKTSRGDSSPSDVLTEIATD